MGAIKKQNGGFTIIELLTVMSVIIILIGLMAPALNMVRRFARKVQQKNQFKAIEVALETFNAEWDGYPPSNAEGQSHWNDKYYCGAAKLCEATLGLDLMGFNPDSSFEYPPGRTYFLDPGADLSNRDLSNRRKYLPTDSARASRLGNLYPEDEELPNADNPPHKFDPYNPGNIYVLCDAYSNLIDEWKGKSTGMPVLYFKADTTASNVQNISAIYDFKDNAPILRLGIPWRPEQPEHKLTPEIFYNQITNENIQGVERPYRQDSFILLSAGYDGVYGTKDDIYNFEK